MKSERFDLDNGYNSKPSYRKFLVIGACASVVAFVVGVLVGRFAIERDDNRVEVGKQFSSGFFYLSMFLEIVHLYAHIHRF